MQNHENKDIKTILKTHGIKPSVHRMMILEYLLRMKNHPTIDRIYSDIIKDIPTLSKTTIYNTVKAFLKNDVIQKIKIEDNEVRFDARLSPHGHFKCTICGTIYDLEVSSKIFSMKEIEGHLVDECQLNCSGTCKTCK